MVLHNLPYGSGRKIKKSELWRYIIQTVANCRKVDDKFLDAMDMLVEHYYEAKHEEFLSGGVSPLSREKE